MKTDSGLVRALQGEVPKGHVREISRRRKEEEAGAHKERPSECNWMHQREEAEEEAQRVTET